MPLVEGLFLVARSASCNLLLLCRRARALGLLHKLESKLVPRDKLALESFIRFTNVLACSIDSGSQPRPLCIRFARSSESGVWSCCRIPFASNDASVLFIHASQH